MRNEGAHLSQKYSFILLKPYGIDINYQGLSTYPSSTVSIVDEHLILLGMNLTSTTTFKETRMAVLKFLQTAKEKDSAMLVKNWVQFLKCENFKKQGQASLVIIIHMLSWYGKSLYGHLDFSWGFVRSLLFLPHRLKARNQILHIRYQSTTDQKKPSSTEFDS